MFSYCIKLSDKNKRVIVLSVICVIIGTKISYELSKNRSPKCRFWDDRARKQALKAIAKFDEPCVDIIVSDGTAIIVGSPVCEKTFNYAAESALKGRFKKIINMTKPGCVGHWNDYIASKVLRKMRLIWEINSRNYFIFGMKKCVWVIGIANTEKEKRAVVELLTNFQHREIIDDFDYHIEVRGVENHDGYVTLRKPKYNVDDD
jgi:hypothetical protein